VDVEVILDRSDWIARNHINDAATSRFLDAGIPLRNPPADEITHAKALLCDDTAIISDANWCHGAFSSYNGTSAQVSTPAVAGQLVDWFESIWGRSTPAR